MLSTSYQVIDKNVYQGNNDKKCGLFLSKLNCDVLVGMPAPAAASVCSTRFRQAYGLGMRTFHHLQEILTLYIGMKVGKYKEKYGEG